MRIVYFLMLLLSIPLSVFAQPTQTKTVEVKTGFGYLTNAGGQIFAKAEYHIGKVDIPADDTYTEVSDQAALDAIKVVAPTLTPEQQQLMLNNQALQEVIANQIVNDPKLAAQQAVIMKALQAQTK